MYHAPSSHTHAHSHRYTSAESNCSLALTLDDCYLKAYFHRGTARVKLGKIEEARDDFTVALRLEPGNKSARSELDKLNKVCCQCVHVRNVPSALARGY